MNSIGKKLSKACGENLKCEHFHDDISETILLEGQAVYEMEGIAKELQVGESIVTPANTSHTVKNIGNSVVVFSCGKFSANGEKRPH